MTTRITIDFPDLTEGDASDAADAIAGALSNNFDLAQLARRSHELTRTFEVRIDDPNLPGVDGLTYEVLAGLPGEYNMTNLGGHGRRT